MIPQLALAYNYGMDKYGDREKKEVLPFDEKDLFKQFNNEFKKIK